jgi:hypothetical protein
LHVPTMPCALFVYLNMKPEISFANYGKWKGKRCIRAYLFTLFLYRCGHHFGKDCLHEWLGLNSLCPLCKQDFRGKDFNASNDLFTEQGATPSSA